MERAEDIFGLGLLKSCIQWHSIVQREIFEIARLVYSRVKQFLVQKDRHVYIHEACAFILYECRIIYCAIVSFCSVMRTLNVCFISRRTLLYRVLIKPFIFFCNQTRDKSFILLCNQSRDKSFILLYNQSRDAAEAWEKQLIGLINDVGHKHLQKLYIYTTRT